MGDLFSVGDLVRAASVDPAHHTRLPQYVRGAVGVVVEREGLYPLADDRARGAEPAPQTVYSVRFAARELFGAGEHDVVVALWESYLRAEG